MSMRSKALENIRAVMEREDNTYRRANGYEETTWEHFRPEPAKPKKEGNFLAGRFLGTESTEPVSAAPAPEPEPEAFQVVELEPLPEPEPEPETFQVIELEPMPELEPEPEPEPEPQPDEQDIAPEVREVSPINDSEHSWLYNEVVKAINDAAQDNHGTKIIAVFIPVVQNGKEFEDLPVAASVELPPVSEEEVLIEELVDAELEESPAAEESQIAETLLEPEPEPVDQVGDLIPESPVEPDPELVEAFHTMEEKLDEIMPAAEEEPHEEAPEEPHEDEASDEVSDTSSDELTDGLAAEEPALGDEEPDLTDIGEGEEPSELLPLPDPAELDALPEIDAGDIPEVEPLAFIEEEEESKGEPMVFVEQPADDEAEEEESKGEPMAFEDIPAPEGIPMPDELEDDEIEIIDEEKPSL